ncbi:MAG: invasion associated locus B family protein [Pseudomonadota bacterium]
MQCSNVVGQEKIGDWYYQCSKNEKANVTVCNIFQNTSRKEDNAQLLNVRIFKDAKSNKLVFIATVPLGTLLPPGLVLQADEVELFKMAYAACTKSGCVTAPIEIVDTQIQKLETAKNAQLLIATIDRKVVGMPISLNGFKDALGKL